MARPPVPTPSQQDPNAGIAFSKFIGLKNTVTAERLGPEELEVAINVDIDDAGQFHRRRGKTRVATGNFHSLFTNSGGVTFCVKNGFLGVVNPDFSFNALGSGYNDPLVYCQVGPKIYFSSVSISGAIDLTSMTIVPWGSTPDLFYSPVVNPTATLPEIRGRLYGKPPLATQLAYFNGRIYLAQGRQVWATELYLYDFIDKTKNFWTFEANVTMIGVVKDGLYVGTTEGVWFIYGVYGEMKRERVMDSGVIPGSLVYIPAELANPPQIQLQADELVKMAILFLTTSGYCGAQDGGVCYNFSETKFVFPDIISTAAVYRMQDGMHQYLLSANSGGTPSANTRIGDYLDAQLIRGGAWNNLRDTLRIADRMKVAISVQISDEMKFTGNAIGS